MKRLIKSLFIFVLVLQGCGSRVVLSESCKAKPVTHEQFSNLLTKHVSEAGEVNYKGFISDSLEFNNYLSVLESNHPTKEWTKDEQLAYWINAYNAYTIQLIIRNYPVESIKDLGGSIFRVNTSWDIEFITICGNQYNLNDIEHGTIRKRFNEPRIHFAVNCASISCPKLLNEAFEAKTLDSQLNRVAREFISNPKKNKISSEKAELSKIFKWFSGDFKATHEDVIDFINAHSDEKISESTEIIYMDYNWGLNEAK